MKALCLIAGLFILTGCAADAPGSGAPGKPSIGIFGLDLDKKVAFCFERASPTRATTRLAFRNEGSASVEISSTAATLVPERSRIEVGQIATVDVTWTGPTGPGEPTLELLLAASGATYGGSIPIAAGVDELTIARSSAPPILGGESVSVELENPSPVDARVVATVDGPFELADGGAEEELALPLRSKRSVGVRVKASERTGDERALTGQLEVRGARCALDASEQASPIRLRGFTGWNATHLAAGAAHTCALTALGSIVCWGDGAYGQLARTTSSSELPRAIPELAGSSDVAAGDRHTCVVREGGVECWGDGGRGQCGPAVTGIATAPVPVPLPRAAAKVFAGRDRTCAVLDDGAVVCWGAQHASPTAIAGVTAPAKIALGDAHGCALDAAGSVLCWGAGGRVGDGTSEEAVTAKSVATDVIDLAAGATFTCALGREVLGAHPLRCWGQLRFAGSARDLSSPTELATTDAPRALAASGDLLCWASAEATICNHPGPGGAARAGGDPTGFVVGRAHACRAWSTGEITCAGDAAQTGGAAQVRGFGGR